MRSTLAVLCVAIAACRLDAQANDVLSGRARLTVQWGPTPQEQQGIERAFLSAGWPLVTGHSSADRATLMVFLSRIQSSDTSAPVTAWTARVLNLESGAFMRTLSCTTQGTVSFPSEFPRRLRRDLADSTAGPQTRAGSVSCKDL